MTASTTKEKAAPPHSPATSEVPIVLPTWSAKWRGAICEAKLIAWALETVRKDLRAKIRLTGDDSTRNGHGGHDENVNPIGVENDVDSAPGRRNITQWQQEDEAESDDRNRQQLEGLKEIFKILFQKIGDFSIDAHKIFSEYRKILRKNMRWKFLFYHLNKHIWGSLLTKTNC